MKLLKTTSLKFIRQLNVYDGHHHRLSLYRCVCGKEVKRAPGHAQRVSSCGCLRAKNSHVLPVRDYSNQIVGRFYISHLIGIKRKAAVWAAVCLNCKKQVKLSPYNLSANVSPCRCRHRKANGNEAMRRSEIVRNLHLQMKGD
jgi:hypothetical protein